MTKDPADYEDEHPGAYDYYAWWCRPKGNPAYRLDTHYNVWVIFQQDEFWTLYTSSLSPRSENISQQDSNSQDA